MSLIGSLAGSNTVTIDTLTTSGLLNTDSLRIGPVTSADETITVFRYGTVAVTGATDTGTVTATVTISPSPASTLYSVIATPYYTGSASPLPAIFVRVDRPSASTASFVVRVDSDTPGTFDCTIMYLVIQ